MVHSVPQRPPALSSLAFSALFSPVYVGGPPGMNSHHRHWNLKGLVIIFSSPHLSVFCRQQSLSDNCNVNVAQNVCRIDCGNVFFSGDRHHLWVDGKGQDKHNTKSGLHCTRRHCYQISAPYLDILAVRGDCRRKTNLSSVETIHGWLNPLKE